MEPPERKSPTEALDIQQKIADTLSGQRPTESTYPYMPPDYKLPFVHIGTEKQLFVDNFMLDHLDGVRRVFPKPQRPPEPLLTLGDLPWEKERCPIPHTALYDPDDKVFKLWYTENVEADLSNGYGRAEDRALCYAESTDALHWHKPLSDRCLPYREHTATNILLRDVASTGLVLNRDRSDLGRKYLLIYCPYGRAARERQRILSTVAASPDGLRWTTISDDSPQRHQHESQIIWDEAIQKWISYGQYSHHWNFLHRKRQIGRQESADFIHWSPREAVISSEWDPNLPPEVEFHDMSVRKVGGLYIGIAAEFVSEPLWFVGPPDGQNWREQGYVRLGGLYSSRDGRRWQRVGGPEPWLDNGPPGSPYFGWHGFTVSGALVHDGKMVIVGNAFPEKQHWHIPQPRPPTIVPADAFPQAQRDWDTLHDALPWFPRTNPGIIGGLVLREDGWAELRPTYEHGAVYTRQFVFEGDTLRVNADAHGGYLRVEALDPYLKPYAGLGAEDCDPVTSDDPRRIWHTVTWRGRADVRALWNQPVRLRFHLHQASLYAFQFQETA